MLAPTVGIAEVPAFPVPCAPLVCYRLEKGLTAFDCQRRRKNVPARRRKNVLRAGWELVPVVHGRDPRAGRCALRAAGGGPRVGGACGPTGSSGGLFGRLPAS